MDFSSSNVELYRNLNIYILLNYSYGRFYIQNYSKNNGLIQIHSDIVSNDCR